MKISVKIRIILSLCLIGIWMLTGCTQTVDEDNTTTGTGISEESAFGTEDIRESDDLEDTWEDYDYSSYIELCSKQWEPIMTEEELEQLEALEWDERIRPYMEYDWTGEEGLLLPTLAAAWELQLADLNQDGQPEMLVVANQYSHSMDDFISIYTIQNGTVIHCGAISGGWRRLDLNCELEYFPSYEVDVYQNAAGEFRYLSCDDFHMNGYYCYQFYESTFDGTTVSCKPVYAIRYYEANEIEGITDWWYMAGDCTEWEKWDSEEWEDDDEMYSAFCQVMHAYMQGYEKVDIDFTQSQYQVPGMTCRLPSEYQEIARKNIVAGFARALGYINTEEE